MNTQKNHSSFWYIGHSLNILMKAIRDYQEYLNTHNLELKEKSSFRAMSFLINLTHIEKTSEVEELFKKHECLTEYEKEGEERLQDLYYFYGAVVDLLKKEADIIDWSKTTVSQEMGENDLESTLMIQNLLHQELHAHQLPSLENRHLKVA